MSERILIDTDPGIDDSLAILLALASPEVKVEGITTIHGNCSVDQATINALSILELANAKGITVAKGFPIPLVQPSLLAAETHGDSGLGYAKLPEPRGRPEVQHGSDLLIEKIMSDPGEITLVAIGPLTNVAFAIRKEPRIINAVKEVIIMGGTIRYPGNASPLAEYNVFVDPHAAHIVFHSGIPITLIPLDATNKCLLKRHHVDRLLKIKSPISRFIKEAVEVYLNFALERGIPGCALHDPLTLAAVIAPELLTLKEYYVDVDISGGVSMGKTFADFYNFTKRPANMKVALDVHGEDFIELFLQRMETLSRSIPD